VAIARPTPDEYAPSYAGYIDRIGEGADPLDVLHQQLDTIPALLGGLAESQADARYAPSKWSVKEVVGHVGDAERVFAYRLLRIARGDATPLSGFDQDGYVKLGAYGRTPLRDVVADWAAVRHATLTLVARLEPAAWDRRGVANGKPVSARALLYIIPGHVEHHANVLRTRYGVGAPRP
jgi:hypothetical protein